MALKAAGRYGDKLLSYLCAADDEPCRALATDLIQTRVADTILNKLVRERYVEQRDGDYFITPVGRAYLWVAGETEDRRRAERLIEWSR